MAISLTTLQSKLRLRIGQPSETELTAAQIADAVRDGIQEYSRYKPRVVKESLTAVSGQQTYSLDEKVLHVLGCSWGPSLVSDNSCDIFCEGLIINGAGSSPDPLDQWLTEIEDEWRRNQSNTGWEFQDRTLFLYPAPATTKVVWYLAAEEHELDGSTVPSRDEAMLLQACAYPALTALAMARRKFGGSVRVGKDDIGLRSPDELVKDAERERADFKQRYGRTSFILVT